MAIRDENIHSVFQEAYDKLNREQKEAVNKIEGAVMVLAGPGTGKTQILSLRIGKILLETDTLPQNILCMTYTDAGVTAMRKRLIELIGPDAHNVQIHTFHSFCNQVIQENTQLFEFRNEQPASALDKAKVVTEIIDSWGKDHLLKKFKLYGRYADMYRMLNLFSMMKREGFESEKLIEVIESHIEEMQYEDQYINKKNKNLKQSYHKDKEAFEKTIVAIKDFDTFLKKMTQKGLYDFDDMLLEVYKAFKYSPNLLAYYQEKYLYLLIDEFQDTGGVQLKLIDMLASYWDNPNVFVVGDNDQSIYRFQGASVTNFKKFIDKYDKNLKTVVLKDNYRSHQKILDLAYSLIENSKSHNDFLNVERRIKAINNYENESKELFIRGFKNEEYEYSFLIKEIKEKIRRGVKPNSIAVLFKKNAIGEKLGDYFKKNNVPVYVKKKKNALQTTFGKNILSILKYTLIQSKIPFSMEGDELLGRILFADYFHLKPIEVSKHLKAYYEWNKKQNRKETKISLRESITTESPIYFEGTLFGENKITNVSDILELLLKNYQTMTLQNFFDSIVRECRFFEYIMQDESSVFLMDTLTAFVNFIKTECEKDKDFDLNKLVDTFDQMNLINIELPVYEYFNATNGVNLITNHSSKGLEFDEVYMVGCNKYLWEKSRIPNTNFKLPSLLQDVDKEQDIEEYRRLFYVSMTRAKKNLYLSYAEERENGKESGASIFVSQLQESASINFEKPEIDSVSIITNKLSPFPKLNDDSYSWLDKSLVQQFLEKEILNVSKLKTYLNCPINFYFKSIIKIPSFMNENMAFGNVVHDVLYWFIGQYRDTKIVPALDELIKNFKNTFHNYRYYFSSRSREDLLNLGEDVFDKYYRARAKTINPVVSLEYKVGPINYKGINIEGRLDKIEFERKNCTIVDYKTGKLKRGSLKPPDEKNSNGGEYWLQAVFYQILMDEQKNRDWEVDKVVFDYIESGDLEEIFVTKEDKDMLWQLVESMYSNLQNYKFDGCNDCDWCRSINKVK